jgi:hypothetical protein
MPLPKADTGSLGDVVGYLLWLMGTGESSNAALLYAQSHFGQGVSAFNLDSAYSLAQSALSAGGQMQYVGLTLNQQQEVVPYIVGAPSGFNYQVTVTLLDNETGAQVQREIRINSATPLDHAQVCQQAYLTADLYVGEYEKWQNLHRAVSAEGVRDIFDCTVTAIYAG